MLRTYLVDGDKGGVGKSRRLCQPAHQCPISRPLFIAVYIYSLDKNSGILKLA